MVHYSGGAGSFLAAKRVVERFGADKVLLLTADTSSEADDWVDFIYKSAEYLGAELVHLKDGRDIWEVALHHRVIPSTLRPKCTQVLKRELLERWLKSYTLPHFPRYFGFDFTELHRAERLSAKVPTADFPLMWEPYATKDDAMTAIRVAGLPNPMAYELGLPHNNCLKYGCFMGGMSYWAQIREQLPDVFARTAEKERELREHIDRDYTIIKIQRDNATRRVPLAEFGKMLDDGFQPRGYGICGCYDLGEE